MMSRRSRTNPKRRRLRLWLIAIGIGVASGAYIFDEYVKDNVVIRKFGVVDEGRITRSGRMTPATMRKLYNRTHVKTMIDLGMYKTGTPDEIAAQQTADELGVTRHRLFLKGDGTGNPNYYVHALRLMTDPDNLPVHIHCNAGAQRTSAAIILYRVIIEGRTIPEVYPEAFNFGHHPSKDWILLHFVTTWLEPIRAAYATGGWIEGFDIPEDAIEMGYEPPGTDDEVVVSPSP
jgi:hypothetical protein